MNSGKIVAGGRDGWTDRGSIRGPRGPKKYTTSHTSQKGSDPFLDVQLKQLIVASPEIEIGLISNYDLD